MIFFKVEDEILTLSTLNSEYAINEKMLRAVLNGYSIDMTEPCTKYMQDQKIGSRLNKMRQEFN